MKSREKLERMYSRIVYVRDSLNEIYGILLRWQEKEERSIALKVSNNYRLKAEIEHEIKAFQKDFEKLKRECSDFMFSEIDDICKWLKICSATQNSEIAINYCEKHMQKIDSLLEYFNEDAFSKEGQTDSEKK